MGNFKKLLMGFSEIEDGNMSVLWGGKEEVVKNRKKFLKKFKIDYEDTVIASLLGGTNIEIVGRKDKGSMVECDGLITGEINTALFMVTADCLPVIFFDRQKNKLGLAHLGWRGVDGRLAQKMVRMMQKLGSRNEDLEIYIGPGVRWQTYIKYGKKLSEFREMINKDNVYEWEKFLVKMDTEGWVGVDLVGYTIKQLIEVGVDREKIEISKVDTIKDKKYFSHYRAGETGEREGRFATMTVMTPW